MYQRAFPSIPKMTFAGQDKRGQHKTNKQQDRTGQDRPKGGIGRIWPTLCGGGGVYPTLKGGTLPRTQDPGWRESVGILIATFLAISLLFFFASFFDAFLGRSRLWFPSQLGSQNRPKSKKNRCQDAIHLGLRFLIDFWSVLALNLDPSDFKKPCFSYFKMLNDCILASIFL